VAIRLLQLDEPMLEFGGGRDVRVKEGLLAGGPFSLALGAAHPTVVRTGLVGTPAAVAATRAFLHRLTRQVPSGRPIALLAPDFPGFEPALRTTLAVDPWWVKEIDQAAFDRALSEPSAVAFERFLGMWSEAVDELAERHNRPDVVICCLPGELLRHCRTIERKEIATKRQPATRRTRKGKRPPSQPALFDLPPDGSIEAASSPAEEDLLFRDFRRALKAAVMDSRIPIQVVTPGLFEEGRKGQQDPATRAWNLSVALFYKAGGIPWRVQTDIEQTCFVGVAFHHLRTTKRSLMYSSLAQAFSSEGDGFALRGDSVPYDPEQRTVHLDQTQTEVLLGRVLASYRDRMGREPLRVVVHKSSAFDAAEVEGASRALASIPSWQLVALRSSEFRLVRQGIYPPHRGSLCRLGDASFLFTTGYSPQRQTYKGAHIPVPLELVSDQTEADEATAREVLALTKMNWNSADDHGRHPITLAFAQKVGAIMGEIPQNKTPLPGYRYYM
jgi:hypothetical protein